MLMFGFFFFNLIAFFHGYFKVFLQRQNKICKELKDAVYLNYSSELNRNICLYTLYSPNQF